MDNLCESCGCVIDDDYCLCDRCAKREQAAYDEQMEAWDARRWESEMRGSPDLGDW